MSDLLKLLETAFQGEPDMLKADLFAASVDRIRDLEAEVARLKEDNKLLLDKLYNADRVHQNLLLSAERPLQEAEAKLRAVGELPVKIERLRCLACDAENKSYKPKALASQLYDLADELEATLKERKDV